MKFFCNLLSSLYPISIAARAIENLWENASIENNGLWVLDLTLLSVHWKRPNWKHNTSIDAHKWWKFLKSRASDSHHRGKFIGGKMQILTVSEASHTLRHRWSCNLAWESQISHLLLQHVALAGRKKTILDHEIHAGSPAGKHYLGTCRRES